MELRHLKYFVKVADEKHFGRAAAALNMAQPPLSRQIKDLEDEIGVRLFDRSQKGAALTPAGRVFLREARDVLARAQFAVEQAKRAAKGEAGELRIGHLAGPGASVIPRAMASFKETHPQASLVLHELNSAELAKAMREGEIDAAFISEPDDNGPYAGMPYKPVVRYPMRLGLSVRHRLAKFQTVPWNELVSEKFWMYSLKSHPDYRGAMIGLCREHGFEPMVAGEVASTTAMLMAVGSGAGVAFLLPPYSCWAPPGVELRPLSPEGGKAEFGLVWSPSSKGRLLDGWLDALHKASLEDLEYRGIAETAAPEPAAKRKAVKKTAARR